MIERSRAPPWIVRLVPYTEGAEWWPGTMLSWRWIDREAGLWTGVVRYGHDVLNCEPAIMRDLIEVVDSAPRGTF